MRPPRAPFALVALLGAASLAACGAPTHELVTPGETDFAFEVPAEFTALETEGAATTYGYPGSEDDEALNSPKLLTAGFNSGASESFQSLRMIATNNEFDPRDPDLENLPNDTLLAAYDEITEADVWGVRLVLLVGSTGAVDFQALVDRRTDEVAISNISCNQACFLRDRDLIDDIQTSWSLEP
ncbi:MAG: hypothetical protein AAGD35_14850 [Actinomycetota bacterium]